MERGAFELATNGVYASALLQKISKVLAKTARWMRTKRYGPGTIAMQDVGPGRDLCRFNALDAGKTIVDGSPVQAGDALAVHGVDVKAWRGQQGSVG